MTPHATIAPSSLSLTVKCPASVQLQAKVPPLPETDEEAEGHAAHFIALKHAAGLAHEYPVGAHFQYGGREWVVKGDMHAGAMMYARALGGPHQHLILEQSVQCRRIHPTECWGTPDARRLFYDAREAFSACPPEMPPDLFSTGNLKLLRVADYKFGHRYVEEFGNYQLGAYAHGVVQEMRLDENDEYLYVEIMIIQPRSYRADGPVRSWIVPIRQLTDHLRTATVAAWIALSDDPPANTNDSCIDCRARHLCKTLQYATGALIDFSTSAELVEMPHDAIGTELAMVQDAIKRLEARETGLAAQAEVLLLQGKPVSFYHLKRGQSRLTYKDDVNTDELVSLGELIGVDLRRRLELKDTLVTPTQAIQMGVTPETMDCYASRPPAALKLARDNSITAKKVFST